MKTLVCAVAFLLPSIGLAGEAVQKVTPTQKVDTPTQKAAQKGDATQKARRGRSRIRVRGPGVAVDVDRSVRRRLLRVRVR